VALITALLACNRFSLYLNLIVSRLGKLSLVQLLQPYKLIELLTEYCRGAPMKKIVLIIAGSFLITSAALAQGPGSLPSPNFNNHVKVGQLPTLKNQNRHTTVGEINQSYYDSTRNSSLINSVQRQANVNNDHTNVGNINEAARRNRVVTGLIVIETRPAQPSTAAAPAEEKRPE
jgi:hypothetical protein